jgi:hypothetical protein
MQSGLVYLKLYVHFFRRTTLVKGESNMWNLIKIEYLKYQRVALVLAASHVLILLYLSSLGVDIARRPIFIIWLIAIFAVSALFGIFQFSSHKKGHYWVYLFQRPIPALHILVALVTAGSAVLFLICLLPYLFVISLYDLQGFYGIELRHYTSIALPALAVASAYLVASQAVMSPHRLAYIAIIPGLALLMPNRTDTNLYVGAMILLAWALIALVLAFRPDPRAHFFRPYKIMVTELGVQQGLFWLYAVLLLFGYEIMWGLNGRHPVTNPPSATAYEIAQGSNTHAFRSALADTPHPDREYLTLQAELSDIIQVRQPSTQSFPIRHQRPSLDNQLTLFDEDRNVIWRFSHSLMLFEGFNAATRSRTGWLGPNGFATSLDSLVDSFTSVPWTTDNAFILDDRNIYSVDWLSQRLDHRYELQGADSETFEERLSDSLYVSGNVATVLSNEALYVFRASELAQSNSLLIPQLVMPLTGIRTDNPQIWVSELVQGYLVATISPMPPSGGIESRFSSHRSSTLTLIRSDQSGELELINSMDLEPSYSQLFVYKGLILSPAMRVFADIASALVVRTKSLSDVLAEYRDIPLSIWLLLAASACLSGALTVLLLRNSTMPRATYMTWITINSLTCVVGITSLLISGQIRRRHTHNETVQGESGNPKLGEV